MRRPSTFKVYAWELRKLRAQKRTYIGIGAAILVPLVFTIAVALRPGEPRDVPFGSYIHETGLAIPLVMLLFGSIWFFPLITALVAGDIVAAEDQNGTLKTILTRSVERSQVFGAKVAAAFTYAIFAIVLSAAFATVAGILVSGFNPLTTLSGQRISAGEGLGLAAAAVGVYLMPIAGVASIALLLSTTLRNSAAAVVGTLMFSLLLQLAVIIPGLGGITPYLLSTQFNAWQGLLRSPVDWEPIVRAAWVCSAYTLPALLIALVFFLRRDVTGG